eukprot:3568428-Rhodomonas_salina.1
MRYGATGHVRADRAGAPTPGTAPYSPTHQLRVGCYAYWHSVWECGTRGTEIGTTLSPNSYA